MKDIIDKNRISLLKYDIRSLVSVAEKLRGLGVDIWAWENIGDPIKQGHKVPEWIKEKLSEAAQIDSSWAYSPTEGVLAARLFLAERAVKSGIELDENNIVFTSGLGHAINTVYQVMLSGGLRVIHPAPTYPAHSSTESFFVGEPPIFYRSLPENGWLPDLVDLEDKIKNHPEIGFILVIAPNNPTGVCYPEEVLRGISALARKYNLGIISDETYANLVYDGYEQKSMATIIKSEEPVPLLIMKSLSKDIPWPGGRCGWLEFYNQGNDAAFIAFEEAVKQSLRVQVCATTLPQIVLPKIYGDARYESYSREFASKLAEQSRYIVDSLNNIPGLSCVPAQAAFYLSAVFDDNVLRPGQKLKIKNDAAREYIESLVKDPEMPEDKKFALYLMAAKGIFVVPLSGFSGPAGFRVTTLKTDLSETEKVYKELAAALREYLVIRKL